MDFHSAIFSGKSIFSETTGTVSFSEARFAKVDFKQAKFKDEAEFADTIFCCGADFHRSVFSNVAYFSAIFKSETLFNEVIFEEPTRVTFDVSNMSNVSFSDSDITKIRFSDKVKWGGDDKFTIIEEEWLIQKIKGAIENKNETARMPPKLEPLTLELVLSVYRNLRENYEFRLRFGDVGKFFMREMELTRKFRESPSTPAVNNLVRKLKIRNIPKTEVKKELRENCWFRRNICSLTGFIKLWRKFMEANSCRFCNTICFYIFLRYTK